MRCTRLATHLGSPTCRHPAAAACRRRQRRSPTARACLCSPCARRTCPCAPCDVHCRPCRASHTAERLRQPYSTHAACTDRSRQASGARGRAYSEPARHDGGELVKCSACVCEMATICDVSRETTWTCTAPRRCHRTRSGTRGVGSAHSSGAGSAVMHDGQRFCAAASGRRRSDLRRALRTLRVCTCVRLSRACAARCDHALGVSRLCGLAHVCALNNIAPRTAEDVACTAVSRTQH